MMGQEKKGALIGEYGKAFACFKKIINLRLINDIKTPGCDVETYGTVVSPETHQEIKILFKL
jgi:hypothetical protein